MAINKDILAQYNDIAWKDLLREDLGDSGNLGEVKPNLDRIKGIFDRIIGYEILLNDVPNYQRIFESVLINFINGCQSQLVGSAYTNIAEKSNKIAFVRNTEESIVSQLGPIFSYLQFIDPTNKAQQEDLVERLKEVSNLTEKVENALAASGKIAEKQEVAMYGSEFENIAEGIRSAKEYKYKWYSWLAYNVFSRYIVIGNKQRAFRSQFWMMFFLALTVVLGSLFVFGKQLALVGDGKFLERFWNTILEQNILFKLILISSSGYLVAYFSRNYSAEMNMYYINKHRQLSLNSHQRILDSVRKTASDNDAQTKNAILLQVAKTMFDIQETGYLKNGNSPVPTTQVIETVRTGISREN